MHVARKRKVPLWRAYYALSLPAPFPCTHFPQPSPFTVLSHRFVQARRLAQDDPEGMAAMCQQLLANDDLETAMRAGDVFAALVDHFFERGNWKQCYSLMGRYGIPCEEI